MAKAITPNDTCPMAAGINVLSGKWKLEILSIIHNKKTIRFNELQRTLGQITLELVFQTLCEWGKEYLQALNKSSDH